MKNIVSNLTGQLKEAIAIGSAVEIRQPNKAINSIVLCGLGGSGIGGKITSLLFRDELKVPFVIVNDYDLPAFVNENTLVIGSSYSGNTEETLATVQQGADRGAEVAVITSGGKLLELARENDWNHYVVPGGEQPRAMLAYSFVQQIHMLNGYGLIDGKILNELSLVSQLIEETEEETRTKAMEVAKNIVGKTPIIYADSAFEGVAVRVRQQINENGKMLCWNHVLPEMTHNELVGWAGGNENFAPIYLSTSFDHPRTVHRWNICKGIIAEHTSNIQEIKALGKSKIEQVFYLIHFTDWVSVFISDIKDIDPIEVDVIIHLKSEMAKK